MKPNQTKTLLVRLSEQVWWRRTIQSPPLKPSSDPSIRVIVQYHRVDTPPPGLQRLGGVEFDATFAPRYLVRFARTISDGDLDDVHARMRAVWKLRQKIIVVCDVADSSLTPRQRKLVTEELKRDQNNYAHWVDGWAVVVRSAAARHTLTALIWVRPPPFEMRVFDSLENANAWATQRIGELYLPR